MAPAQRRPSSKTRIRTSATRGTGARKKLVSGPIRVLIVDDDEDDVVQIKHCLGQASAYSAKITQTATLDETRIAIAASDFDVALIDFHPGKDIRPEVMQELGGRSSEIALIFLTSQQSGDINRQALEAGALHLVSKQSLAPEVLENAIFSSLHAQKIENQLNDTLVELERANRARADFFAQIGHDLKAPLNSVLGYSEAIANETFGPINNSKYREYGEAVHEAGAHLLALIENLIHFSAGENQGQPFAECDLNTLVEFALRMTDLPRQKRGHTLKKTLPKQPVLVRCQSSAISQAIINLLTNAIKYTVDRGQIEIQVRKTRRHAEVMVKDNGIGMSRADISIALQPFGRVPLPPETAQDGTGLGLHIIREIMARHKGQLDLASAPGNGTTAILRLPLKNKSRKKS